MFINMEGALWLREAFMQSQYHLFQYPLPFFMGYSLVVALCTLTLVLLANMSNVGAETWNEWREGTPPYYWLYIWTCFTAFYLLGFTNFVFLYAAMKDFQRRNYVNELLN